MRRGQVPLIILAIALLLVVYVYFLPLSEKCKIVNMPECIQVGETLFSISPGVIESKNNDVQYSLPNVELFTQDTRERNTLSEAIQVKKGWFSSYSPKLSLSIHENSKEVTLYIFTGSGKANVELNGKKIATIDGAGQHTFTISSSDLKQSNALEIFPKTPFFPWQVNKIDVGKVLYEESYTLTQEKINLKVNIKEDLKDIESATLTFKSDCFLQEDNLSVIINDTEIANGLICPDFSQDVTGNIKNSNDLTFFSKGNYYIYHASLNLKIKESGWQTYYFNLPDKQKIHMMKINFIGEEENKVTVYVNEKSLSIEISESSWQTDIAQYLNIGQNKIVIIPITTVNIGSLEIYN